MDEQLARTRVLPETTNKEALEGEMDSDMKVGLMRMGLRTQVSSSKDFQWVEIVTTTLTKQGTVQVETKKLTKTFL